MTIQINCYAGPYQADCQPVEMPGFEEFQFVAYRPKPLSKNRPAPDRWMVAEVTTGVCVEVANYATIEAAASAALFVLIRQGKENLKKAIKKHQPVEA